ncbi:MAG TPA: hypothetical protein VKV21_09335 [Solirubrobacteraceae bacterium]|nr:hypothetical protein [Solirubrobacteraceae bacterium]
MPTVTLAASHHLSRLWEVILALHIFSAVIGFGIVFAYPLFMTVGARLDATAMPWFHQMQQAVSRRLVSPALVLVVVFGVALASKLSVWGAFYVQWGIGAAIVIGALEGMVMIPRTGRLAELARRDVGDRVHSRGTLGPEYHAVQRQVLAVAGLISGLVLATVVLMALHVGG